MKRRLLLAFGLAAPLCAQTNYTTYTGTIRDLAGNVVTSGRITFTLNASTGGVIPGTGAFVSNSVSCSISSSGAPVSSTDGVSPCNIVNNTALTPSGTYYTLCIQGNYATPGSCYATYATGGTVDMSVLVPTPTTQPYYGVSTSSAPVLGNNQQLQSGNSSGALGGLLQVTSGNVVQIGDISNKFGSLAFLYAGNTFLTVNGSGATWTVPLNLAQFSVNGSVNLTGAQGNGSAIQTYSTSPATGPACFAADGSVTNTSCTNGSTISLTTTGSSGAATLVGGVLNIPQYSASGGGVGYTSPTVGFLPLVSSIGGSTTQANSTFSDVAGQAAVGDPLNLNGGGSLTAQGTATSGQNYACNPFTLGLSYYNAGAVADAYTLGCYINSGTAPTNLVTFYGPATLAPSVASNGTGFLFAQNAGLTASATNGNINTPKFKWRGATMNSSGISQLDDWTCQGIQGTGDQPTSAFTCTHTGSTGEAWWSVPEVKVTGGNGVLPGMGFPCAAFSTYPAASAATGYEECVTDSTTTTWGATVTGGGTNNVQMRSNGTNWTVVGK